MLKEELDIIKERIKSSLLQLPDNAQFNHIHFSIFEEVIEEIGWEINWDGGLESDGWEYDFWVDIIVPNENFHYMMSGSWYYSETTFEKIYDN